MTTASPPIRRSSPDHASIPAASVIGGLSGLSCGLYLWLLTLEPAVMELLNRTAGHYTVWLLLTLVQSGLLLWYRRRPVPVFGGVFALFLLGSWIIGDAGTAVGVALPVWFAVFALTAYGPPRWSIPLVVGAWLGHVTTQLLIGHLAGWTDITPQLLIAIGVNHGVFYSACAVVGATVRAFQRRTDDALERARLVQSKLDAEAAEAVARERNRMARELHDLAAHQLVDVVLTARTVKLTSRRTGDVSHDDLDELIEQSTAALHSVRSAVGALRDGDPDQEPDEPLSQRVDRILRTARTTRALTVVAHLAPAVDLDRVGPAQRHAVARVLTEGLSNAGVHAPGAPVTATVAVETDDTVTVEVANPLSAPASRSGGFGLIGAAERAAALGGTFRAGPDPEGTWRLVMRLGPTDIEEGDPT
ncbi:signal transduction histidine kinase [Stackebrandtia endophytica]|uniref:histidine kinase n=1 Tax=Stackebrandtia endophytica TaxID=1496996 RepID=A0A543B0F3_9ACTN|nr:histidine kinase [Stackebrandtia endophytica]TQL78240.1 signal transduction histidine kinase [Stackebrandtia endophytica]